MYDQSPPVTWPSCSWTMTCSRTVQPWPPTSRGSEPPWSRASIAALRRSLPCFRDRRPLARSNSSSSGWSTSRHVCAGARLELELPGDRASGPSREHDAPAAPPPRASRATGRAAFGRHLVRLADQRAGGTVRSSQIRALLRLLVRLPDQPTVERHDPPPIPVARSSVGPAGGPDRESVGRGRVEHADLTSGANYRQDGRPPKAARSRAAPVYRQCPALRAAGP